MSDLIAKCEASTLCYFLYLYFLITTSAAIFRTPAFPVSPVRHAMNFEDDNFVHCREVAILPWSSSLKRIHAYMYLEYAYAVWQYLSAHSTHRTSTSSAADSHAHGLQADVDEMDCMMDDLLSHRHAVSDKSEPLTSTALQ